MTRGEQVLAQLVLAEVKARRLTIQGNRFVRDGVEVRPVLAFEPHERHERPGGRSAAAGLRPSADDHEKRELGYPRFAELPANQLVSANKPTGDRHRKTQQHHSPAELMPPRREAAQRLGLPVDFAPLPAPALTRKDR